MQQPVPMEQPDTALPAPAAADDPVAPPDLLDQWTEPQFWCEREERDAIEAGDAVEERAVVQPWLKEQLVALPF